jgi:hypothetical protein
LSVLQIGVVLRVADLNRSAKTMTFDECITILKQECQVLSPEERTALDDAFFSGVGLRIVAALEEKERSGLLKTQRFKKALKALYWNSR